MARVLIVGNSHIAAVTKAQVRRVKAGSGADLDPIFLNLSTEAFRPALVGDRINPAIRAVFEREAGVPVVCLIGGNDHNVFGLLNHPQRFDFALPEESAVSFDPGAEVVPFELVRRAMARAMEPRLKLLELVRQLANGPSCQLESPPPVPSAAHITAHPGAFAERIPVLGVAPAGLRARLWRLHSDLFREACARLDMDYVPAPPEMLDADGCLVEKAWNDDPTHGNARYGERQLIQIAEWMRAVAPAPMAETDTGRGLGRGPDSQPATEAGGMRRASQP
ncbi:hypothetical protein [Methylobrevis pamukkalensis]|uniref:SGNH hydrolase-type esterase domain-containing protein n=1 Tax=Methylobrevis pamukkalensis TaxID=1439726 RepID=A0A1E3H227_9HYPH|nr:hypothetical protein [Methylobrevis pamukkalensis]ODN70383.1 hypothetical protein A6302_02304 [Methylobrevis pamukkalensis]